MNFLHRSIHCRGKGLIRLFSSETAKPNIAIVGSGPAGFYTAQQILKGNSRALVDIYDKLPVPFGLVRFGVAPDHPEVKNVITTFTKTANNERCSLLGNVTVGQDISVEDLQKAYSAVVLAYGAEEDRTLGIPGEDLPGVHSARAFVGWYNGLPEHADWRPALDTDTVVVLGQGNVAIDVARILLTPVDILRKTDITEYALSALSESQVKRVYLVGRRGPLQVAFTTAELREMVRLNGCRPSLDRNDFQGYEEMTKLVPQKRRRLTQLLMKTALEKPEEKDATRWANSTKEWSLKFMRSPVEFFPAPDGERVGGVRLVINRLQGEGTETQKAIPTQDTEDLACGLVFRSIGYKSVPTQGVPFDESRAVIPNENGRVDGKPGLYCSGWVKRGPVGVIVSTMNDAFETGKNIVDDLNDGKLNGMDCQGKDVIMSQLQAKGINPVTFHGWHKIDAAEIAAGKKVEKPREKITDISQMLKIGQK